MAAEAQLRCSCAPRASAIQVRAVPRQGEHKLPSGEQPVSSGRLLSS